MCLLIYDDCRAPNAELALHILLDPSRAYDYSPLKLHLINDRTQSKTTRVRCFCSRFCDTLLKANIFDGRQSRTKTSLKHFVGTVSAQKSQFLSDCGGAKRLCGAGQSRSYHSLIGGRLVFD
jgi:hypothetical protein